MIKQLIQCCKLIYKQLEQIITNSKQLQYATMISVRQVVSNREVFWEYQCIQQKHLGGNILKREVYIE